MRVGSHPHKLTPVNLAPYGQHRVIIPVYIPEETGYFEESRLVLEQCLSSLITSTAGRAAITVVVNSATHATMEYLEGLLCSGELDQLIVNRVNRGKVDAVVAAMRSAFEPFITVADSDIYFHPGWLPSVEKVFAVFPESGFVSAFPCVHLAWYCTSATVIGALSRAELGKQQLVSGADIDRFVQGIGYNGLISESQRQSQWVVQREGFYACLGASHMQFTLRREIVSAIPPEPALEALSGSTDRRWLDEPVDQIGFWRLSTVGAHVEHMGNRALRGPADPAAASAGYGPSLEEGAALAGVTRARRSIVASLPWRARRVLTRTIRRLIDR